MILCILKGKMPFKKHKIIFFSRKKIIEKKTCVPTLHKIFRPVTRNTLIFLFGLSKKDTRRVHHDGPLRLDPCLKSTYTWAYFVY